MKTIDNEYEDIFTKLGKLWLTAAVGSAKILVVCGTILLAFRAPIMFFVAIFLIVKFSPKGRTFIKRKLADLADRIE